jgi:phosphoesterase RecJ-like protein
LKIAPTVACSYLEERFKISNLSNHQTSYTTLTQDELNSFDFIKGDTEGIVNYGLSIKELFFGDFYRE